MLVPAKTWGIKMSFITNTGFNWRASEVSDFLFRKKTKQSTEPLHTQYQKSKTLHKIGHVNFVGEYLTSTESVSQPLLTTYNLVMCHGNNRQELTGIQKKTTTVYMAYKKIG